MEHVEPNSSLVDHVLRSCSLDTVKTCWTLLSSVFAEGSQLLTQVVSSHTV